MRVGFLPARTLQRNTQSCSDVDSVFFDRVSPPAAERGDTILTGFTAPNRFGYGARIYRINIK
ncbi:hypothetical protein STSP1_01296 [Sedimentisphaera salicampi]|uniref:Uncharacterized protein n=1 Tax=Sedimentisphaera salicampi TaxID=1941349 RepID=A0A1W6LMD6_9BACT|nr:hypothetical protein STSP1_01296 [Sedimentisphaera salicampi]